MSWKSIDTAPRDGRQLQVRDDDRSHSYWVRYWTKEFIASEEWDFVAPGWYDFFPNGDPEDGEEANPTLWWDQAGS